MKYVKMFGSAQADGFLCPLTNGTHTGSTGNTGGKGVN